MEKYIVDCKYYINGNCNWSEIGRKESRCICIPGDYVAKKPEDCIVKRILDSKLENKL